MLNVITVQDVISWQESGEKHTILDVREPWETQICKLPGCVHIPLGSLPAHLADLPQKVPMEYPVVTLCHHGRRSQQAALLLSTFGYKAYNLQGGIHAWATQVENSRLPTY